MSLNKNVPGYNHLINGSFDIWQRGTSQTTPGFGSDDRWRNDHRGTKKVHRRGEFEDGEVFPDGTPTPKYYSITEIDKTDDIHAFVLKHQRIILDSQHQGQEAKLTFYAKSGEVNRLVVESIKKSPNKKDVRIYVKHIELSDKWEKHTVTFHIPVSDKKSKQGEDMLDIRLWFNSGKGNSIYLFFDKPQSGIFNLAQFSLLVGDVTAEPIQRAIDEELRLCCEYYQNISSTQLCTGCDYEHLRNAYTVTHYGLTFDTHATID